MGLSFAAMPPAIDTRKNTASKLKTTSASRQPKTILKKFHIPISLVEYQK
jgi:hypothetical protein